MTAGEKLKAIESLTLRHISYVDHHDIGHWAQACGSHYDTTVLTPKSIERIEAIFARFFVEV